MPKPSRRGGFRDAVRGLVWMARTQSHARVHLTATAFVLGLSAWLQLGFVEWGLVLFAIGAVWTAEAFNSALEELADALHPEHDAGVGRAKDVAAGAVLIAAITAALVGLLVLGRRLLFVVAS